MTAVQIGGDGMESTQRLPFYTLLILTHDSPLSLYFLGLPSPRAGFFVTSLQLSSSRVYLSSSFVYKAENERFFTFPILSSSSAVGEIRTNSPSFLSSHLI